jgi:hypothetical protein
MDSFFYQELPQIFNFSFPAKPSPPNRQNKLDPLLSFPGIHFGGRDFRTPEIRFEPALALVGRRAEEPDFYRLHARGGRGREEKNYEENQKGGQKLCYPRDLFKWAHRKGLFARKTGHFSYEQRKSECRIDSSKEIGFIYEKVLFFMAWGKMDHPLIDAMAG